MIILNRVTSKAEAMDQEAMEEVRRTIIEYVVLWYKVFLPEGGATPSTVYLVRQARDDGSCLWEDKLFLARWYGVGVA